MRCAFLEDVGRTALNLIDKCGLCHNDIRLHNIAFRDGRFCLLDFDMLREGVEHQPKSAFTPSMLCPGHWGGVLTQMCYSVAQVAANVFVLDSPEGGDAGRDPAAASCIWSTARDGSVVDTAFQRWAEGKGALVLFFVSAIRLACLPSAKRPAPGSDEERLYTFPEDFRGHLVQVLRDMLA